MPVTAAEADRIHAGAVFFTPDRLCAATRIAAETVTTRIPHRLTLRQIESRKTKYIRRQEHLATEEDHHLLDDPEVCLIDSSFI